MQIGQRRPGRGVAEPKAPAGRREFDMNRERLVFCLTSLVGHRVTAKLRGNIIYEGTFHSCSLDNDFSITLKCARLLPSESCRSGEVISTLLIPGKDFLQVSAVDVPSPSILDADQGPSAGTGFATDADIAQKKAMRTGERELVPWAGGQEAGDEGEGLDEHTHDVRAWDQFDTNAHLYGVTSTYHEELYTTKLDPSAIPKEKREEAERIAREIESGQMASEVDGRIEAQDQDGDEEAAFSSVQTNRAKKDVNVGSLPSAKAAGIMLPLPELPASGSGSVPLTREHLSQHDRDNLSTCPSDGFAREHRTKRGMITAHSAHSPMRSSPMLSEMKRINALNLEPALPKLDDKTRNDWINFKQNQTRNSAKSVQGNGLKHEFQQSLEIINRREAASKQREQQAAQATPTADTCGDLQGRWGGKGSGAQSPGGPSDAGASCGQAQGNMLGFLSKSEVGAESARAFTFNPKAKEFSFNPSAAVFSPSGAGGPPTASPSNATAMSPQAKAPAGPTVQFQVYAANPDLLQKTLGDILESFFDRAQGDAPEHSPPDWPEATGSSFHEALGQPNASSPVPPAALMSCAGGTMPGPWQQQGPHQMPQGGAPQGQMQPGPGGGPQQMVPQGFMVAAANAPGGQQPQMYPQMYPGSGPVQRPQNGGNMPSQQQPMVFNQQAMVAQQHAGNQQQSGGGQPMAMPAGMVNAAQGGQNPGVAMGPVPKFGAQMVPMVMPAGQYPQGNGSQHSGQQGQMMQQQGQMGMQPAWGQPDGRRHSGGPHQMGGMEG
mmetsp:Transcript_41591/g.114623  ORF Transcript_41591/g.114623 Transcript_41591/m.114623 type:complete len:776 (+) Transcript_41591:198-2525(+)